MKINAELIVTVAVVAVVVYLLFFKRERYGIIMDQACAAGDCSTAEGRAAAEAQCLADLTKSTYYERLKNVCGHPDPEIRKYGCPESCVATDSIYFTTPKRECLPNTRMQGSDGLYYCKMPGGMYVLDKQA